MEVTMVWTETTREQYRRGGRGYASDTTDAEWLLLSFFLPPRCRVGRPREGDLRGVINPILYILGPGCQWRALPTNFPPRSSVQYYFYLWRDQRIWWRLNLALARRARGDMGRTTTPPAGAVSGRGGTRHPRPERSTTRASKPRKVAVHAGLMCSSGLKDASATSSPTRKACCWRSWCSLPTSRMFTAPCRRSELCDSA